MNDLSRVELLRQVKKFIADDNRGISIALFCELCGISKTTLRDVFLDEKVPMSVPVQIRVNKGLREMRQGRVKIMQRRDRTRYVDYRREPQPVLKPQLGLVATSEGIKLRIGLKNRSDYSGVDLDEALRG